MLKSFIYLDPEGMQKHVFRLLLELLAHSILLHTCGVQQVEILLMLRDSVYIYAVQPPTYRLHDEV